MDVNSCIIAGLIFLVLVVLMVRATFKFREESDQGQLANAAVYLLCAIAPCYLFFFSLRQLTSSPVVSSCEIVVTQQGDTLYEFQDSTRYCRAHIEETDTSTVFVTIKEDASLGLSRGDICLYCHRPLCEHSKHQVIDSDDTNNDWGWDGIPY